MSLIENSNVRDFWRYFDKICAIPRCSQHEEKIREFVEDEANRLGYKSFSDDAGNLVVIIEQDADSDNKDIVLQCHLDMVCQKNEGTEHDFSKDPIKTKIVERDGITWLMAEDTTLGADNGVGIAYLLTIMKRFQLGQVPFNGKKLFLLFTVQEELGLIGAVNLDKSLIKGNYLINLDGESDTLINGCAGGITTEGRIPFTFEKVQDQLKEPWAIKFSISGLRGGHSGVDINKDRVNSIKLMSKFLWKINDRFSMSLTVIKGGTAKNAIPRESYAIFWVESKDFKDSIDFIKEIISETKLGIGKLEPELHFNIEELEKSNNHNVLPLKIKDKLIHMLYVFPHGPISMHPTIKNLVYTSTNLASIDFHENEIIIATSQRSFHEISKKMIYQQVEALFKLADLNVKITHMGDYPGWEPDFDAELLKISKRTYKSLFKKISIVQAIHAGLECGILKKHFPEMDMISFGAETKDNHSPDERLNILSVEKTYDFLIQLLKNIK